MKSNGLNSTVALQNYFNKRIQGILKKSDKHIIGWDEILMKELKNGQAKEFFEKLVFSPTTKDEIIETANNLVDAITGVPHLQMPMVNHDLSGKRCDISVDVVEMTRETYQKIRLGN